MRAPFFPLRLSHALLALVLLSSAAALTRIHLRVQSTLIGYEIGKLKDFEAQLLKKRSLLTVELAKITSKHNLEAIIAEHNTAVPTKKALALQ